MAERWRGWTVVSLAFGAVACGSEDGEGQSPPADPLAAQCMDAIESLYEAPTGLARFDASARGEVVGCAPVTSYTAADVESRLSGVPGVVIESGGVHVYLIAYRTAREPDDIEGLSTALVYVPERRMSEQVPLVLAAHGTVGLADHCAPSRQVSGSAPAILPTDYIDALFLAWAARGLPVVGPDYAGLGNPGVHDIGNWFDPARSAVDGLRALRGLYGTDALDGGVLVQGHSQGGGVALTVGAIASELPQLTIRAVVATTPSWRASVGLVDALSLSSVALTPSLRAAGALSLYSSLANLSDDPAEHGLGFEASVRDSVVEQLSTLCYNEILTSLDTAANGYVPPATIGEFVDPTFVQQVSDCRDGGDCSTLGGRFFMRDEANEPHLSASSPPVLITASTEDEALTLGQVGCFADRVEGDGATLDFCIHTGHDHLGMVSELGAYSIEWALAAAAGQPRPACTGTGERVPCSLF